MLHMWQLLASISTPAPAQDVRRGHLRGALNGMKREAGVLAEVRGLRDAASLLGTEERSPSP